MRASFGCRSTDLIDVLFDAHAIERCQRQAAEDFDSTFEFAEYPVESGEFDLLRAFNCSRIFDAPMGGNGLTGPHRTGFTSSLVADGKHKIQIRRAWPREFVPTLAAQAVGRELQPLEELSVGYYRNKNKGEKNEWTVTYDEALIVVKGALDEALIVVKGALTIRYADGVKTAKAGEIIFLTKGTAIAYEAGENDTEVVYVSYPHWLDAQQKSEHAHLLDSYHPVA